MSNYFIEEMLPLNLVATGTINLINQKTPLSVPYPIALQRGLDQLCALAMQANLYPPKTVIELLDWCQTRPLSDWPIQIQSVQFSSQDFLLLNGRPTALCEELACLNSNVEDEITENAVMKKAFDVCRTLNNPDLYVVFRRFLIQNPVIPHERFFREKRNLRGLEEVVDAAYEPAPPAYSHDGKYIECAHCRSLLVSDKKDQLCCEDSLCRQEHPTQTGYAWDQVVLQLKRGLRRFVVRPGRAELLLFEKLQAYKEKGVEVELWPDFDAYDLKITVLGEVWAVDVKDWANPFLLARSINDKGRFHRSTQSPWTKSFWVFPNERYSPNGYYMAAFKNTCRQLDEQTEAIFEKGLLQKVRRKVK